MYLELKKRQATLLAASNQHNAHFKQCLGLLLANADNGLQAKLATIHACDALIKQQMKDLTGPETQRASSTAKRGQEVLGRYALKVKERSLQIQAQAERIDQQLRILEYTTAYIEEN